jgi:hypothetical protein
MGFEARAFFCQDTTLRLAGWFLWDFRSGKHLKTRLNSNMHLRVVCPHNRAWLPLLLGVAVR